MGSILPYLWTMYEQYMTFVFRGPSRFILRGPFAIHTSQNLRDTVFRGLFAICISRALRDSYCAGPPRFILRGL